MATVTLATLRTRAKRRADLEGSSFISDAEWNDYINEAYGELYDTLVTSFQNYFVTEDTFALTPGTSSYALPASFYKLISLDIVTGNQYEPIFPYNELERSSSIVLSANIPNATVRRRYIPVPTTLSADGDSINDYAGWSTLVVTDAAIMALEKEESDTSSLERRRARQMARITALAQNRDVTMPGTITDVTVYDNAYIKDALRYRIYGGNLEFINITYLGV